MALVYLCAAWLAGLYAGRQWPAPAVYAWLAAGALVAGGLLWRRRPAARWVAACGLAAVLAFLRAGAAFPPADIGPLSLGHYNGGRVALTGAVAEAPDVDGTRLGLKVAVDSLRAADAASALPVQGAVWVTAALYPRLEYGDRLEAAGYLQSPSAVGGLSYEERLRRQGASSVMQYPELRLLEKGRGNAFQAALLSLRERARRTIARILPDPEGALLTGILLGIPHAVPRDLMDSFNATGTSHIIVISGFNIAVVAMVLAAVANRWLPRRRAVLVAIAGVALYTLFVGAGASVVRAALMGSLALAAVLVGRQHTGLTALAAAVLVMTLWEPGALWDVGFQLSAAATLGLVLFAWPLYRQTRDMLGKSRVTRAAAPVANDAVAPTLAAQIFTLPLILFYFGRLSVAMPAANLLVLPAQPMAMGAGALATLAGMVWLPAGQVLGWVAWLFLAYTIRVVEALASLPGASADIGRLPPALIWAYFGVVLGAVWLNAQDARDRRDWPRRVAGRLPVKAVLGALLLVAVLTWAAAASLPDGLLHVRFLDVGQGDAVLITTPGGQRVLVDGGPNPVVLLSELGRALPFWERKIDWVALTHPDKDHLSGLVPLLERYQVEGVLETGAAGRSPLSREWEELLQKKSIPRHTAAAGMVIDLGHGATMDVLSPPASEAGAAGEGDNNASLVLRLAYGQTSFLLTGDLEERGEQALLQSGRPLGSTVLKVSHHGAGTATTPAFLRRVAPQLAVISVGENRFGHPLRTPWPAWAISPSSAPTARAPSTSAATGPPAGPMRASTGTSEGPERKL